MTIKVSGVAEMVAAERAADASGVTYDELAFCDEINDSAVQVLWNVAPNSELIIF